MSYRPSTARSERGQALVESIIVMPVMIFLVLGALQLVMIQHGRIMTEYAAYNAARAGIVHNANWNVMRNAAMVSTLPLYGRTDRMDKLALAWGKMKVLTEVTELVDTAGATLEQVGSDLLGVNVGGLLPDVSLVEVDVTSPTERDFQDAFAWQRAQQNAATSGEGGDAFGPLVYPDDEIDFDDKPMMSRHPRAGRLAIEVRVLLPLRVPLVNWIMFQMWYAQNELRLASLRSNLQQWSTFEATVEGGAHDGQTLEDIVSSTEGRRVFDDWVLTQQRTKEARLLRDLARSRNIYLMPLRGSYAMQMQSNAFFENRRQPLWFSLSD